MANEQLPLGTRIANFVGLPVTPKPLPVPEIVGQAKFVQITTDIVIPEFESGYYHPDMALRMSAKDRALLAASGETMYGLDRKAGAALSAYPEWASFWAIIDHANARLKWKHYYMGDIALQPELKRLASTIMAKWFASLSVRYLTKESLQKIANDDRLIVHFSYAAWNGPGWFQKFAKALQSATGTKEQIFELAISARINANSLAIRNAGGKMLAYFNKHGMNN